MLIVSNISTYYVSQSTNFIWPHWPYTIIFCTSGYLMSTFITVSTLDYAKQRDNTQQLRASFLSKHKDASRVAAVIWAALTAALQSLSSSQHKWGQPWALHHPFAEPEMQPRTVAGHQPLCTLCNTCITSCIFSSLYRDVFPSLCWAAVSREGVPTQHTPETELLVEMWPAGQPFWWDEMHQMNFLDLWFPPSHLIRQLSNTAGTCSQDVLLKHVWSHRLSPSSFPQFIFIAPETQTSCYLQKFTESKAESKETDFSPLMDQTGVI